MHRDLRPAIVALALAACRPHPSPRSTPDAAAAVATTAATTMTAADAGATVKDARDAAVPIDPAQRAAYRDAIRAGRRATIAREWPKADEAFSRALEAVPGDARALAERGYARHLATRDDVAKNDFELALASADPSDKKLLAQIEFNLGLVEDALGDKGLAAGHFRRSYELSPTEAAKERMGSCPVSVGVPVVTRYASVADATAKLPGAGFEPLGGSKDALVEDGDPAHVLLPLDAGGVAVVDVGSTAAWRCGVLGEASAARVGDAWKVTYQAHRGVASGGLCTCDGTPCETDECTCDTPLCAMSCSGADDRAGTHVEAWIDAKTGAGLGRFELDGGYLSAVTLEADPAARTFRATGLGCK